MLVQFKVKNFRSFGEETTFSMVAADENPLAELGEEYQHSSHLLDTPDENVKLLRGAAIYGANASGKSNLVKAMGFIDELITTDDSEARRAKYNKLHFAGHEDKTVDFQIDCLVEDVDEKLQHFSYSLSVNKMKVESESLYKNKKLLFQRERSESSEEYKYTLSDQIIRFNKGIQEGVTNWTSEYQTFLRDSFKKKVHGWEELNNYFESAFIYFGIERDISKVVPALYNHKRALNSVIEVLQKASFGITDMRIKREEDEGWLSGLKDSFMGSKIFDQLGIKEITHPSEKGGLYRYYPEFKQQGSSGGFALTHNELSNGSLAFIFLIAGFYILNKPKVIIIDELDLSLHTSLVKWFLKWFFDQEGTQIIFNTHDTNLFSAKLFRPDELWLVRKRADGVSILDSLIDFKYDHLRELADNLEEHYLFGRFGAVPKIYDDEFLNSEPVDRSLKK